MKGILNDTRRCLLALITTAFVIVSPCIAQAQATPGQVSLLIGNRVEQLRDEVREGRLALRAGSLSQEAQIALISDLQQAIFRISRLRLVLAQVQFMPQEELEELQTYFEQFVSSS